jgi:PAS domain-containing protein
MTVRPGHVVVYGNPAFRAMFGEASVGLPARESMIDLPATAFALLDAVLESGRPLARWIRRDGHEWRLTAVPRREDGRGEVYGVAFHLRARDDLPVLRGG